MNKRIRYEIALVEEALSGSAENLRAYLEPLVRNMAAAYELGARRAYPSIRLTQEDLERAAWLSLDDALHKYAGKMAHLNKRRKQEIYAFTSYFAWCVRQAVLEQISKCKRVG